jgi:AcrR family transcriptional regulator
MAESDDPPKPLYPKLSGRTAGIAPDQVARNQRQRLMGATVEAVFRRGYEGVTVSELVALAGVSKSAFYRQFAGKEACFLATYEEIVEQGAVRIEVAYRRGKGLRESLEAAFAELIEIVDSQPAAARLVFVDSLSLGTAANDARERTAARYEAMIAEGFAAAPLGGEVSPVVIRAIFGGMRDFAHHCLRDHEPERLREHASELVDWAVGYRLAAAKGLQVGERWAKSSAATKEAPAPSAEAEDSHGEDLEWEEPANSERSRRQLSQRERIVRATAQVAADNGYGKLTVPAISAAAGTSNQTFYTYFASKEKAFLAAFDALALQAFEVTGAAYATKEGWLEAGTTGMRALIEFIAANRTFRQMNFFELYAAGPVAQDRAEAMLSLFAAFMQPDPPPVEVKAEPPRVVIEAIAGGLRAVLQHEIVAGRSESLPELLPEIFDVILLPFGVE